MIAKDFPATLKMLADIGFQSIELCSPVGYTEFGFGSLAKYKGAELKKIINDAGLTCVSSHFGIEELRNNWEDRIAWASDVGLIQMIVPSLGGPKNPTMDDVKRAADQYNKLGEKAAKSLKEVKGSFTASALMPTEPLLTVDNVLKSAGKTVKGANGGSLSVKAIDKMNNGDYQVQISMENMPAGNNPFGGMGVGFQQIQIQIGGGGNVMINGIRPNQHLPTLVDAKGQSYQLVNIPQRGLQINNGVMRQDVTLVFRPQASQGEPARLVLNGQRSVNFQVPFSFTNVPLP